MSSKDIGVPIDLLKSRDESACGFKTDAGSQRHLAVYTVNQDGNPTGLTDPNGADFLVVSTTAPSDDDGRPDGTIYLHIQG